MPERRRRKLAFGRFAGALVVGALIAPAIASTPEAERDAPKDEAPQIELAPAVKEAIDAPYLSEEERAALRVRHGVWTAADLSTPERRAMAALVAGVWHAASLADPAIPVEMRADAMLRRGELGEALAALEGTTTIRAARIRAEALEGLGRFDDADKAVDAIEAALRESAPTSAAEVTDAARGLWVRARVRGQPAQDYHRMLGMLTGARERLDRLDWTSLLAEAALLYEKDNRKESVDATLAAISLCPALADGWEALGRLAVDGFNFEGARQAAARLDELAKGVTGDDGAVSPQAALIRARAWLRQREARLALEEIETALTTLPKHREALALRCAALAVANDLDAHRLRMGEFQAMSPGSPVAAYITGKALSEARQYDEAAAALGEASRLQARWPAPLIELGLLQLQSGRDTEARDALRKVADLDPFNVRARNSLTLIEELLTYETIESDHFIVRFKPGVDRAMAREMPALLEEIHAFVCTGPGGLEHEPNRKTVVELLPDHEWFAVRITGMPDIHTVAASTGPVIAMEAPKTGAGHEMGEYDWVRVVRHEYVHTVSLSRTRNRIPHWFTEACAVHYEGGPIDYGTASLLTSALRENRLFDLREINIAFVLPKKPGDRAQAYAQGHQMYEHMLERFGARAPLDLMDLYRDGVPEGEAFERVLGVTGEAFLSGFKGWLTERARAWGMLAEPSMGELLMARALASEEGARAAAEELGRSARRLATATGGGAGETPEGFDTGELDEDAIDEMLAERPDHPDLLRAKVDAMLEGNAGAPSAAMTPTLERYAAARPVDDLPHRMLARLYLSDARQAERAIPHLEYLDAREQNASSYAYELTRRYAGLRRLDEAAAKAERATQVAPFNAGNRELAATVALMRGDFDAAERHVEALTLIEPDRESHKARLEKVRERRAGATASPTPPSPR